MNVISSIHICKNNNKSSISNNVKLKASNRNVSGSGGDGARTLFFVGKDIQNLNESRPRGEDRREKTLKNF